MRRAWTALLASSASLILSRPAPAQWRGSVDVGVSRLRQTGIPESAAQTLGATVDGLGTRGWFHGAALSSLQPNTAWTGQALAVAGLVGPIAGRWSWEVGAAGSGFGQTGAPNSASGQATGRLRFGVATGGAAVGAA